ncbi:MAG: YdaU family protein [Rhodospirillales bacterium]|nr:YdaU family protein [Rhodospirillales bacterium]
MSFASMPIYTGDYLRDTRHLTPAKHGIYLLLLMYCWDQKAPVPLDEQEAAGLANCRSADEVESLRYVLNRFFVRLDDGWYNKRIQEEIERYAAISSKRAGAARDGAAARAALRKMMDSSNCSANAHQLPSKSTTPSPSPSPSPSLSQTPKAKDKPTPSAARSSFVPAGVSDSTWQAFKETRAKLRAPLTDVAAEQIGKRLAEFATRGHDPEAVVLTSIERGWRGVFEPRADVPSGRGGYSAKTVQAATNISNAITKFIAEGEQHGAR